MVDFKAVMRRTLLIVDDDVQQLELRALALKMSGFTVLAAAGPVEAISIMAQHPIHKVGIAILDYNMPLMNGGVLGDYFRARYPDLKIILHSGAVDIQESDIGSIDVFVPKGDGIERLLEEVSILAQSSAAPGAPVIPPEAYLHTAPGSS